jgi:hypothetical protein
MQCEEIADVLAASADLTDLTDRRARKHVETCLRCQAEVVQYRKLLKALHGMREDLIAKPHGLVGDIFVKLETAGERATPIRPFAWISFEWTAKRREVHLSLTTWPTGETELLAVCHPYGDWLDWRAP